MLVKVKGSECSPETVSAMELNFGQPRCFQEKKLYLCEIEFADDLVVDLLVRSFNEIKEDNEKWEESWAIELCRYSSVGDFKEKDKRQAFVPFLEFIAYDLIMELMLGKHLGQAELPEYVVCALVENSVKYTVSNIRISAICYKSEQLR